MGFAQTNFGVIDTIIVVAYLGISLLIGIKVKRYAGSMVNYIGAGRKIGPWLGVATMTGLPIESGRLCDVAELFGYVRGAFPGAVADRPGLLLLAQDGTLHLGEVGDMPLDLQQRLLEVIETGTLKRAGSQRTEQLDVRIIASTSHDLQQLVQSGQFLARLAQKLGMRSS